MSTVLVVDDDDHLRQILGHILTEGGFSVVEARTAAEADTILDERPVDAILLDVMIPGLDGLSYCRELKSLPGRRKIPVLMCTARSGKEDIVEAIRSGADDYIVKPFTRDLVLRKVGRALRPPEPHARTEPERRASGRAPVDWFVSWGAGPLLGTPPLYKNKVLNISRKGFAFEFERCGICTGYEVSTVHPMCLLAPHATRRLDAEPLEFVLSISRDVVVEVRGMVAHVYQPPDWKTTEIVGVAYTELTPQAEAALKPYVD
jgi:CheY-like chemotaxis protein